MKLIFFLLTVLTVLYACSGKSHLKNDRTTDSHLRALARTPATAEADAKTAFGKLFTNFKKSATEDTIRAVYAEKLYFNDTFRIISDIDDLVTYFTETAHNVESTNVEILDVIKGRDDYFIKWSMRMKFKVKGKEVDSQSLGMTQIRFNQQGLIIFHQDYWDSSEAFFEHLPMIGRIVKGVKEKL